MRLDFAHSTPIALALIIWVALVPLVSVQAVQPDGAPRASVLTQVTCQIPATLCSAATPSCEDAPGACEDEVPQDCPLVCIICIAVGDLSMESPDLAGPGPMVPEAVRPATDPLSPPSRRLRPPVPPPQHFS